MQNLTSMVVKSSDSRSPIAAIGTKRRKVSPNRPQPPGLRGRQTGFVHRRPVKKQNLELVSKEGLLEQGSLETSTRRPIRPTCAEYRGKASKFRRYNDR